MSIESINTNLNEMLLINNASALDNTASVATVIGVSDLTMNSNSFISTAILALIGRND
jgi:hypothetical protein